MRLLNDGNGKDTDKAITDLEEYKLQTLFSYRQAYFVGAKAQRQLCIEWGEEDCSVHLTHVTRAECPLCRKSLKEER